MPKKGLYANMNARKKAGTSRPKKSSTVTPKAYKSMKAGFPKKKQNLGGFMPSIFLHLQAVPAKSNSICPRVALQSEA